MLEDDLAGAEELVYCVAFFEGDEEEFARAFAPVGEEVGGGEEDGRGVGEGAAEEHGGAAAVDEEDAATTTGESTAISDGR